MGERLKIFRIDLSSAKDASYALFEEAFSKANPLDMSEASSEVSTSGNNEASPTSPPKESCRSTVLDQEDLFRQAAYENLLHQSKELGETRKQFETWPSRCDDQRDEYMQHVAIGVPVPPQTEFDNILLHHHMLLTGDVISAEKAYEAALAHAKATGAVSEYWGNPVCYGDEFDAQSLVNEEEIAYQQTRDWTPVEVWREGVANVVDGGSCLQWYKSFPLQESDGELMDLDEWTGAPVESPDESHSVVAYDKYKSQNIKRWQEIRGHR